MGKFDKGQGMVPMHRANIFLDAFFHLNVHWLTEVQSAPRAHATGNRIVVGGHPGCAAGCLNLVELQIVLMDTAAGVWHAEPQGACQHPVFEQHLPHLTGTEQIGIFGFHCSFSFHPLCGQSDISIIAKPLLQKKMRFFSVRKDEKNRPI